MVPHWLHDLSIIALALGGICAVLIALDEIRNPQQMWIMNVVWPVSALFGTGLWLWGYLRYGRSAPHEPKHATRLAGDMPPNERKTFSVMVAKGTSHCGAGCTLGDICAEWLALSVPTLAVGVGWHSIFTEKMFAVWVLDFIFAYLFGIVFQYFTIAPMRGLNLRRGLWAAIKADTLSLTAWQFGMYGFMAVASLWIFGDVLNFPLKANTPEFWFMMQLAMLCGFVTSYPVNWWLLKIGIKEKM